jgi:TonB-dependent receptor
VYLFLCFFFVDLSAQIQSYRGSVRDKTSGDVIFGVKVTSEDGFISYSGMNGKFDFHHSSTDILKLHVSHSEFKTLNFSANFTDTSNVILLLMPLAESLGEIDVKAKFADGSERQAKMLEKNSENIINVIPSKTIELLPDITTAAVLQRVSGVAMERTSTGDARYAVIRGMDQRYNYTLVNGIKIPSPDNKYRFVPMDMFPSDLLDRLEVVKSLTAKMEGDAIGGAMNLVMKDAPKKLTITSSFSSGFNTLLLNRGYMEFNRHDIQYQSPSDRFGKDHIATPNDFQYNSFNYYSKKYPLNGNVSFSIGNRFLKDKLGIIISVSTQNLYRGANSVWIKPNNQPLPGNFPSFEDLYTRQYNTHQFRMGINNKIDYKFNNKNKISLYNLFLQLNELQYRKTVDTSLSIGRSGNGTGNTYTLWRSRIHDQSIYNSTLQGEHMITAKLKFDWSLVKSLAKSAMPDWSEYQTVEVVGFDINGKQYATPKVLNIPFYRIWTRNSDKDFAEYFNVNYQSKFQRIPFSISIGGMHRDKHRDNQYNEWNLIPKTSSIGQPVIFDGALSPDKFQFNGTTAAQGNPINPLIYKATEKITSTYFMIESKIQRRFHVNAGVRYEKTQQGWTTAQDPKISYGAIGLIPYNDLLPSANLKYAISKNRNIRLSYYSAVNRPGFFEYVPFHISDDNFSLSGNPKLKHTTSNNYDLRYDVFSNSLNQFLLGVFYKEIINPIEMGIEFTGTSSATMKPFNYGTAKNLGGELNFAKYWGVFGISGNYTFTHSRINTAKLFYNKNYISEKTSQIRPLQGQSPHIANFSFLIKSPKLGLDAQLACVYNGKKIIMISPYKDLDYWQRGVVQLDFSIEKAIVKDLVFYVKVNNILNAPVIVDIVQPNIYQKGKFQLPIQDRSDRVTVQKDYYGQNIIFGIRLKKQAKTKNK